MANRPPERSPPSQVRSLGGMPPGWRVPLAVSLYLLVCLLVFGGIAAHVMGQRLAERDVHLHELRHEIERRELARLALETTLGELRRTVEARDRQLAGAAVEGDRLVMALAQARSELAALEDERNLARDRARLLDRGALETELWLETAQRERLALERERALLEERLAEVEMAREAAHRREAGLRWRLESTEQQLAELAAERDATERWLTAWVGERLGAIEAVLERTGLPPDRLLGPAVDSRTGQGGPLLPLAGAPLVAAPTVEPEPGYGVAAMIGDRPPLIAGMAGELQRLAAAERLLAAVPLAAPFDQYHLTSAFGPRIDPITRRRALHNGLDFGAPEGSEVLATAPGRVTNAGRAGSYGIMVEIDHGHGLTTRYAHLSRTLVDIGDRVGLRTPVGVIGSTGRSTGRHLHYEVRLDGAPRDPAGFIAAGRELIEALGS